MRNIKKDPKHLTVMLAVCFIALALWFAVFGAFSYDMNALLVIGEIIALTIPVLCYTLSESMNCYVTDDNELLMYGAPNSLFSGVVRLADVDKIVVNRRFFTSVVTLHYYGRKVALCPEDLNGFLSKMNSIAPQAQIIMK